MHLPHIAREIAKCTGKPFEQLAQETTANANSFFRLAPLDEIHSEEDRT
jgi:Tat protein secretion system quality control protein TatD with DNase activity